MTAEQPSQSHLFPIPTLTHGENKVEDIITKKRKRLLLEEEEESHTTLLPPIEKSPRRDDYQVVEILEEKQTALIDVSKLNHKERLLAYKRIWDNLDLSKPADAKLEPFVWQKIREYQRNK